MKKDNFVAAYDFIKKIEFNTTTMKKQINRQRSPFVGLLLDARMIEE